MKDYLTGLVISAFFLIFFPGVLFAQSSGLLQWIGPDMEKQEFRIRYHGHYSKEVETTQTNEKFQETRQVLSVAAPCFQDEKRQIVAVADAGVAQFDTDVRFPDTKDEFPGTLWDLNLGGVYRQRLTGGRIAGGLLSVGSASDRPFRGEAESVVNGIAFIRFPRGERNGWIASVFYSSNREFLNNIPLPGLLYWYSPNEKLLAVAGIPMAYLSWRPLDRVTLSFLYYPVRTVSASLGVKAADHVTVKMGFDWRNDAYFRADRREEDDRLFYYEKRVSAGIVADYGKRAFLEITGGYAFDRFYFEGEDYGDRDRNRIDTKDGPFLTANLRLTF